MKYSQKGFGLVSVLVALGISLAVIASVSHFFAGVYGQIDRINKKEEQRSITEALNINLSDIDKCTNAFQATPLQTGGGFVSTTNPTPQRIALAGRVIDPDTGITFDTFTQSQSFTVTGLEVELQSEVSTNTFHAFGRYIFLPKKGERTYPVKNNKFNIVFVINGGQITSCQSGLAPSSGTLTPPKVRLTNYPFPTDGHDLHDLGCHHFCSFASVHDCNKCGYGIQIDPKKTVSECPTNKKFWQFRQIRGMSTIRCMDIE